MTEEQKDKLTRIAIMDDNWNGYGASKISFDVIKRTENFLNLMNDSELELYPVADGYIQAETNRQSTNIEFDIYADHIDIITEV